MKIKFLVWPLFVAFVLAFTGCTKDKATPVVIKKNRNGVFITNEGAFMGNNASISFFDLDSNKIYNNYFESANGVGLGDVVQSYAQLDSLGFIAVNGSAKIVIVNLADFKIKKQIAASYPRYMLPVNQSVYVTNGKFPGKVLVVDYSSLKVTDSITVGSQPEHLIKLGDYVYVANGKWGNDSTVSKINIVTKTVEKTIKVGDGATDLVADVNGKIWVLCQGLVVYDATWTNIIKETDSRLVQIDPATGNILKSLVIGAKGDYFNPQNLAISGDGKTLFYGENDGIYSMKIDASNSPATALITVQNLYGFNVDKTTGNIFACIAPNYTSAGNLKIYKPDGTLVNTYVTGIIPNGAFFTK